MNFLTVTGQIIVGIFIVVMAIAIGWTVSELALQSGATSWSPKPLLVKQEQVSYILKRIEVAQVGNGQYSYSSLPGWVAISFDGRYVTLRKVEGK